MILLFELLVKVKVLVLIKQPFQQQSCTKLKKKTVNINNSKYLIKLWVIARNGN